jgi:hypothetical protein
MWKNGRWQCLPSEASSLLQLQLGAPSVVIDRWGGRDGHLQLAVAANLLSSVIPLLRKLETGPDILLSLKVDVKAILDTICDELVTSDMPDNLRSLFSNGSEVMKVFNIQDLGHGGRCLPPSTSGEETNQNVEISLDCRGN